MSITTLVPLHVTSYVDLDADATAETIKASTTRLYAMEIDNTANTAKCYVKLYAASPTVGTTNPYIVIPCAAADVLTVTFNAGQGISLAALYAACTTEAGTAGTTGPTNGVKVTLWSD